MGLLDDAERRLQASKQRAEVKERWLEATGARTALAPLAADPQYVQVVRDLFARAPGTPSRIGHDPDGILRGTDEHTDLRRYSSRAMQEAHLHRVQMEHIEMGAHEQRSFYRTAKGDLLVPVGEVTQKYSAEALAGYAAIHLTRLPTQAAGPAPAEKKRRRWWGS